MPAGHSPLLILRAKERESAIKLNMRTFKNQAG